MKKTQTLILTLFILTSIQVYAMPGKNDQFSFQVYNQQCRILKSPNKEGDRSLPTVEECREVESIIGEEIPSPLKEFFLSCGNRALHGYEIAHIYGGDKSSLVKMIRQSREEDWRIPDNYFPFCRDQDVMYCLNKKDGSIVTFERFQYKALKGEGYEWSSLVDWITFVLT